MATINPLDVSLILPAYNERATIRRTIEDAVAYFTSRKLTHEIIVAADGTDGTRETAAEMIQGCPSLKVIGGPERGGKGRAVRNAVCVARGRVVGFSDADNKTPIAEFDKVRPLLDAGVDVVIGSRGMSGARIERAQPWYRRYGSRGFRQLLNYVIGLQDIYDTQCGFKFFQQHIAQDLFARQRIDGYMFDVEILHLARCSGYRIEQVAVRWKDDGDSRLSLFWGNLQNLSDVLRIRYKSITADEERGMRRVG